MSPPTRRTGRAIWDVAVGVAAAVVAFAAVPGVLAGLVGDPLPSQWSRHAVLSLHGLFDLLAVVAWVAWAACAWPLLRSVVTRVRARDASAGESPDGLRMGDRLALRIAAAVLAVASMVAAGAGTAGASTLGVSPATVATIAPGAGPSGAPSSDADAPRDRSVAVAAGDSLWSIAEAAYEDGGAWPTIAAANLGRIMDDGARFVDPNVLRPGWTLRVPPVDAPAPPDPPDPAGALARSDVVTASIPLVPRRRGEDLRHGEREGRPHRPAGPASPGGLLLPELSILGTGALVAALLARRSRQTQRLRSFVREEGTTSWQPGTDGADLGRAIANFEDLPLLEWVELSVRMIGSSWAASEGSVAIPAVQLLRAGADGVEVRFASAPPPAPGPWVPAAPRAWLLPPSVDLEEVRAQARRHRPWCPVLLPLGDDDRGTWLLPLTAGACLSVIGPAARALAHAMVAGTESWTWREELVITGDPGVANQAARTTEQRPDGTLAPRVLFAGDPRVLAPTARRTCAVITLATLSTADVSVLVDDRAATVHPLGLTVRPHLLRPSWSGAVAELGTLEIGAEQGNARSGGRPHEAMNRHSDNPRDDSRDGPGDASGEGFAPTSPAFRQRRPGAATVRVRAGAPSRDGDVATRDRPDAPGAIEVRVLTPLPSIEGLAEALPPKRARRATELIAYLALHAPQPITGDRLRTRVLGTADADAASKTLFNTVGAARRALGPGTDGLPLLPPASRSGHYCLSPAVTVDARRCVALADAGRAATDPTERMALLQAALAIVDGEPLSGALAGYAWWRAEGHERRVADAVVDAACALTRAAVEARQLDLGRWALDKARLIEPYSEALTRGAMGLAAAAGDARRLHLEWEACRRQVDELDPGGSPSEATEVLYARLREHLRGGAPADEPTAILGV